MHPEVREYNETQEQIHREICDLLAREIEKHLPEAVNKMWHAHPVWFLNGNPTVGYSKQKPGIRLMFWSGTDFDEPGLNIPGKKFKDASVFFNHVTEVSRPDLKRWINKSREIQWDYRNVAKRSGQLVRLT